VRELLESLFKQQRTNGFQDLAGTDIAATISISDQLLNEQIARALPQDGFVRDLQLHSRTENEITVTIRVAKGTITLPIDLVLAIASQPEMPHRPVLGLRFKAAPMFLALGGPMLSMFKLFPQGISMDGDGIAIDTAAVLESHDLSEALRYVTDLRVSTRDAALVLELRIQVDGERREATPNTTAGIRAE
jgi:hypothetical protein